MTCEAVKSQFEVPDLLTKQRKAIDLSSKGKTFFVNLPTGFGKVINISMPSDFRDSSIIWFARVFVVNNCVEGHLQVSKLYEETYRDRPDSN